MRTISNEDVCVCILMATYNGSSFLCKQIESIINQTYKNWKLIISDDGSEDRTVDIVNHYANLDSRIKLVNKNRIGGVIENFSHLLKFAEGDYIFLCDQDDLWHEKKIEKYLKFFAANEISGKALGVFSDMILIDEFDKIISDSFYLANNLNPLNNIELNYLVWRSTLYGCSFAFNKKALEFVNSIPNGISMHDHWIALNILKNGEIIFLEEKLIYYRQHSKNLVGGKSNFYKRIKNFRKIKKRIFEEVNFAKKQFTLIYGLDLAHFVDYRERLNFLKINVLPYSNERLIRSLFFSIAFMLSK